MKKLSEKFWVGKHSDYGFLIHTATKSYQDTSDTMDTWYEDWCAIEEFSIVLCELVEVDTVTGARNERL